MATDAFETWMGFWTGRGASIGTGMGAGMGPGIGSGQTSPLLDLQRQMLQAWAAPWMALGLPGLSMPAAGRREAPRPAPRHGPQHAPQHATQHATQHALDAAAAQSPAAHPPAPPEDLPWSPGPAAPVAILGAQARSEAPPVPEPQRAAPRHSLARHMEPEPAAPVRRPRKATKTSIPPRAAPARKAARPLPEDRSPATSGRRITKPPRKPTH